MAKQPFTLSIVCPAFNEETVLPLFHAELSRVLAAIPADCNIEVVYVDDGSRDRTLAVLRDLAAGDDRIRFLSFSRNFGHQAALTAGLEAARGDVVIMMDSDLQHPPNLIPTLLQHWRCGHEVVVTIRDETKGAGWLERSLSRSFYTLLSRLSDTEIRPAAADFRLMSRRAVDALLSMHESHRFLRGMVQWLGFPTIEVHYTAPPRAAGVSKYNLRRKARFALDGLFSFSKAPLRLSTWIGVLAIILGCIVCGSAILGRTSGQPDAVAKLLLGSCYLLFGAVLGAVGVLGEYIGRIYDQVRARPAYVVKEFGPVPPADRRANQRAAA